MSSAQLDIVIVGAGGAGVEALWVASRQVLHGAARWNVLGFVDDNPKLTGTTLEGKAVIGTTTSSIEEFRGRPIHFHCAIGNNRVRQRIAEAWQLAGFVAATLIDPTAVLAESAEVAPGAFVGPLSIIAPHARVGRHVLINSHVGVGHHAVVGDFAQLCPGVRVNGGCKIDSAAFLGSNAVVHPGLSVGEGASVGAGSFVIRSVKPRHSVLGVPARIVSRPAENGPNAQA